jgi:hypothetical protein
VAVELVAAQVAVVAVVVVVPYTTSIDKDGLISCEAVRVTFYIWENEREVKRVADCFS